MLEMWKNLFIIYYIYAAGDKSRLNRLPYCMVVLPALSQVYCGF